MLFIVIRLEVSKLERSKQVNLSAYLNMYVIEITQEVLKLEISKEFKEEQE